MLMGTGAVSSSMDGGAPSVALYLSVGLVSGAIIALQIAIMRVFSVGSWAHFGSLVVSLAMMGFGLTSVVMCAANSWFERNWRGVAATSLFLFGPLMVGANLAAQQVPFNAIFLVSDAAQKWRLLANFALYLLPFLAGAFFLGSVFLRMRETFSRVYFADLVGAGLGGLVILGSMYLVTPEDMILVPLVLWAVGSLLWFIRDGRRTAGTALIVVAAVSATCHLTLPGLLAIPKLAVSDYKGVAYARKFPDATQVYRNISPFGDLQVYGSSYLHFAPGLSDNAAFNLPTMPANAYLGMYIDGEGPFGIMRNLSDAESAYFHYLPMEYPYVLKRSPETFVVQFGGGISTRVALHSSDHVTVAEGNPAILSAFRNDPGIRKFSGDILNDPRLSVVDYDGRLFLATTPKRYDVVDLSLADSAGLSNPGGFAIVEKYPYTREAMTAYMHALKPGGILSVTLWNKEEPPKSVLKLYSTMAEAARAVEAGSIENDFFVSSTYLSTATVLYKRGGFTADEVAKLRAYTKAMSFDEIAYPSFQYDTTQTDAILAGYRSEIFGAVPQPQPTGATPAQPASGDGLSGAPDATDSTDSTDNASAPAPTQLPATTMGQLAWYGLIHGGWADIASRYVFDARPLTNDRPYFAAYVKPKDLPFITDRLDIFQDEWGYLLLWATLGIAAAMAVLLIAFPVAVGWRTIFSRYPGQWRIILYFACLGLGYIMVEVSLIAKFVLPLSNPTVSASILITGMLVFSGLGSLASERLLERARTAMPIIFVAIGALLIAYGLFIDPVLDWIGGFPYALRLVLSFLLIAPPAFLMGFPMSTAMTWLGRMEKQAMFIWAWGINGSFSVIGAAAVPIIATAFGLSTVLEASGVAYLLAIPAFFAIFLPVRAKAVLAAG